MKFSLFFLLSATFSSYLSANEMPLLELAYNRTGSVPPQYQVRDHCEVFSEKVRFVTKTGGEVTFLKVSDVKWTNEIKNSADISNYLLQASKFETIKSTVPQPVGGPIRIYSSSADESYLMLRFETMDHGHMAAYEYNDSNEAHTLVDFLDLNCEKNLK